MRVKSFVSILSFICLLAISLMSGSVNAKTPDGLTPAEENVCDAVKFATRGLYGLCVVYCEAQDLDAFDKKPASIKLLENYNKKMKPGDPEMPCVDSGPGDGGGDDGEPPVDDGPVDSGPIDGGPIDSGTTNQA